MKTIGYFLMIFTSVFLLSSFQVKNGDKQIITRKISITDYEKVEISGNRIEVQYRQTSSAISAGLTVTADKNILEMYRMEVKNGTLFIEPKKEFEKVRMRPSKFLVETNSATLKQIDIAGKNFFNINTSLTAESLHIEIAGASELHSRSALEAKKVSIEIAGSGKIYLPLLTTEKITTEQAGSGIIHLGGQTDRLNIEIAGNAKVEALEMKTKHTSCEIAGNGKIEVTATETLKVEIAGMGKVRYRGNPIVKKDIAGIGSVKPVN